MQRQPTEVCKKSCIFYSSGKCIVEKYGMPEILSQDLDSQYTKPGRKCLHPEIFSSDGVGNFPTEEELEQEAKELEQVLFSIG